MHVQGATSMYDIYMALAITGGIALIATVIAVSVLIADGKLKRDPRSVRAAKASLEIAKLNLEEQEAREKADQVLNRRIGHN